MAPVRKAPAKRTKKAVESPEMIAVRDIEKSLGNKGTPLIFRYGDSNKEKRQVISFGYPEVDAASNIGGVPRGKLVEIFGLPSAGKSFLSLKLIASAQAMGLTCCLIDAEQSFDPTWAEKHGVVCDDLWLFNAALSAEKTLDYVNAVCKNGKFGLVVLDSTAALVPNKEMEGSVEDQDYALLARAMSKACRKIVASCGTTLTTCVFINQVRDNIGGNSRGNDVVTCGGKALPFYAHQRLSVWPGGMVKAIGKSGEEECIAKKSRVTFMKNKTATPYGKCEIEIIFDALAMNPIVKMVTLAKSYKLFGIRLGDYYIHKDFIEGAKKNHNTETSTFAELAHWVMENGLLENVLDSLKEVVEDEEDEDKLKLIDPVIYELIATIDVNGINEYVNKELWVSPYEGAEAEDVPTVTKLGVEDEEVESAVGELTDEEKALEAELAKELGEDLDLGE